MYAAKKYLLTRLLTKCLTELEKELRADTVCTMLEQSMSFEEDEFKKTCLKFISKTTHRVFNAEEFLHLSHEALEEIVSLDALAVNSEREVYESCVKWARDQLLEMGKSSPSDEEIRAKLGNVLYKICFPAMTLKDFADLTARSTVLTVEEQRDIYVNMANGMKLETTKFLTQRRRMNESVISRFDGIERQWEVDGDTDAVSIETSVDVCLTGVGLYGGVKASTHNVTLEVLLRNEKLSTTVTKMTSNGSQNPVKIELKNPVHIHANNRYTVAATMKGPETWSGVKGKTAHDFPESGRIIFFRSDLSSNWSGVLEGQIPQLFYFLA